MISLIIGIMVSLVVTIVGTPLLIKLVHKLNYGQYIRQDGPKSHLVKRGTPTLGGVVINLAVVLGWCSSALYRFLTRGEVPSWSAVLVLFAMLSMGFLGFIDDFAKVRKKQSEGLTVKGKFIGQFILATIYAVLALILPTKSGFPSAQAGMSFIEKPFFSFEFAGRVVAIVLFVIWVNFLMTAWTNAINLTDGLDGLAAGSSMIAFIGYAIIAFWEFYHLKGSDHPGFTYAVSDPLDLTIIAACAAVACFGFLWYNSNPASIFMGDTGSLALGGLFAAMSIATHTEFLAIILGGLFVGIGAGLIVRRGGASGGDDALALILHQVTGWKISRAYFFTDFVVLMLSISYIPLRNIFFSLLTVTLSSAVIELLQKSRQKTSAED